MVYTPQYSIWDVIINSMIIIVPLGIIAIILYVIRKNLFGRSPEAQAAYDKEKAKLDARRDSKREL